jgi:hypothetical protein
MPSLTRSLSMLATYPSRCFLASRPPARPVSATPAAARYLVTSDLVSDDPDDEQATPSPQRSATGASKDA